MARPSKYVTRSALGWPSTSGGNSATPRSGLVVHYDSSNQNLANKNHSECIAYWQWCRRFHTGTNGWADVGYSFMACAHGYVLEGRGIGREQAAQPGGNRTHYSVTLATGPSDEITGDQINAVRELRLHLMTDHSNAGTILGHRDFIATSCPGDRAYALVQDGTFTKAPGPITGGVGTLLGLKEGDGIPNPNEGVKAVQRLIVAAGFGAELEPHGVDGQWGADTSTGLLKARQYVGSKLTSIKTMTGESYAQLIRACARREAERAVARVEVPECECTGGSGDGAPHLPTTEEITITGTLNRG